MKRGFSLTGREELFNNVEKVVVKIGTSSITGKECDINPSFMDDVAVQVSELQKMGKQVILVSSGAIGVGLHAMGVMPKPKEIPIRQAAASIGQSLLMQEWKNSFEKVGLKVAQILLTYDFYSDRVRYLNLRNNLSILLEYGVIPIINENDAICVNEIEAVFGDNDKLSAMVASKVEADLLIILSDVDGLYDKNPKKHKDATLISTVKKIDSKIESFGGNPTTTKGVGGMKTKIQAAKICCMSGCDMVIANSLEKDIIRRVALGEDVGTLFLAKKNVDKNKTRWIILSESSGKIQVDRGAMYAIINKNSLLPSGVVKVSGSFDRGDIVEIDCEGMIFAKGITDYTSEELKKVKGIHSNMVEKVLGYTNYQNVIKNENIGLID